MKIRTNRVIALTIVFLMASFMVPHVSLWDFSKNDDVKTDQTSPEIGSAVASAQIASNQRLACIGVDNNWKCAGLGQTACSIFPSDVCYQPMTCKPIDISQCNQQVPKPASTRLACKGPDGNWRCAGIGRTDCGVFPADVCPDENYCKIIDQTLCYKDASSTSSQAPGSTQKSSSGTDSSTNTACTDYSGYTGTCQDVTQWTCPSGVYVRGACPGNANNQCCVQTSVDVSSCTACQKEDYTWCSDGSDTYCADAKSGSACVSPYSAVTDCTAGTNTGGAGSVSGSGTGTSTGSSSSDQACLDCMTNTCASTCNMASVGPTQKDPECVQTCNDYASQSGTFDQDVYDLCWPGCPDANGIDSNACLDCIDTKCDSVCNSGSSSQLTPLANVPSGCYPNVNPTLGFLVPDDCASSQNKACSLCTSNSGTGISSGASCSNPFQAVCTSESGGYSMYQCLGGQWARLSSGLTSDVCVNTCNTIFPEDCTGVSSGTSSGSSSSSTDWWLCNGNCQPMTSDQAYSQCSGIPYGTFSSLPDCQTYAATLNSCTACLSDSALNVWCTSNTNPSETSGKCLTGGGSCSLGKGIAFSNSCPGYAALSNIGAGKSCASPGLEGNLGCVQQGSNYVVLSCSSGKWTSTGSTTFSTLGACNTKCQSLAVLQTASKLPTSCLTVTTDISGVPLTGPSNLCESCINNKQAYCDPANLLTGGSTGRCIAVNALNINQAYCSGNLIYDPSACPLIECPSLCQQRMYSGGLIGLTTTTSTNAGIPVGSCSPTNPIGLGGLGSLTVGTGVGSTGSILSQPIGLGRGPAYGCNNVQDTCWCYRVNTGAVTGSVATTSVSSTIPGTTTLPNWNPAQSDPAYIDPANVPAYQANQPNCDLPTDATVAASVTPALAQGGDQITVSGDVGKLTDQCLGYQRNCRAVKQVPYTFSSGFFKDTYKIQNCPSDYPKVVYKQCGDQVGQDSCSDWHMAKVALIAALVTAVSFCVFASIGAGAGLCAQAAAKLGFGVTTVSQTGVSVAWGSLSVAKISALLTLLTTSSALITGKNVLNRNQIATQIATTSTTSANGKTPSFSVCANDYKTDIGAAPVCQNGGYNVDPPSVPMNYTCGSRSCQGFAYKSVQITIYNSLGQVAMTTTTNTDVNGHFTYSFTAPSLEGTYSAVVVVPGLASSAASSATANAVAREDFAVRPLLYNNNPQDSSQAATPLVGG